MGTRGPAPRNAATRQRRNTPKAITPSPAVTAIGTPTAPRVWLRVTKDRWTGFWTSEVARAVNRDSDLDALFRLFELKDQREREWRTYRRKPMVPGSMGQPRLNPLADHIKSMDSEIRALEDRFGMTPSGRARLGIQLGQMQSTLADLNRSVRAGDSDEIEDEDDPVAALLLARPDGGGSPASQPRG